MNEDAIFRALGDPTRRAIFERLAAGGRNLTELRNGMAISQPAMSQHLAVLREAGLVRVERRGRFTHCAVEPEGIGAIGRWLARYRAYWPERVEDLRKLLKEMEP